MTESRETVEHFTAWLTTDRSCLAGEFCDVSVLADEEIGERDGRPVWASTDRRVFHAETTARHDADTDEEAVRQATELLGAAGWRTVGDWRAVPSGSVATVERPAREER